MHVTLVATFEITFLEKKLKEVVLFPYNVDSFTFYIVQKVTHPSKYGNEITISFKQLLSGFGSFFHLLVENLLNYFAGRAV